MGLFEGGGRGGAKGGGGGVGDSFPLECIAISKTGWHTSHTAVEPLYNEPLCNEVLGITNDFTNKIIVENEKVPRYNKTLL